MYPLHESLVQFYLVSLLFNFKNVHHDQDQGQS
jgi:hypothetical protein